MLASDIVKDDLKLLIPNLSFTHDICGGSFGTRDWIQGFTYTRQAILGKHSTKVATFPVVNKVYNFISCGPKLLTISTVKEVEGIKHILRERERKTRKKTWSKSKCTLWYTSCQNAKGWASVFQQHKQLWTTCKRIMTAIVFRRPVTSSACSASHSECNYSAWSQRGYKSSILSGTRSFGKGICPGSNTGPWTKGKPLIPAISGFLILIAQQQK